MAKRGGFPGGMPGNMNNLMKQAQRMQRQMEETTKELETKEYTAASGGGAVSVTVNGKKVNIPSFLVKPGDVVEVAEKSRSSVKFKRLTGEDAIMVTLPQWLEREKNTLKGTVTKMPAREDIDMPIEEHLIVELYSK